MAQNKENKGLAKVFASLLALIVWQLAAEWLHNRLLLVGPVQVLARLAELVQEPGFWNAVVFTFSRITLGFLLACLLALVLAVISARFPLAETLLHPYMLAVQTVPVASFIVIALLWLSGKKLSIFISFLMVLPVLYANLLQGIRAADGKLLEMARVFRMPLWNRVRCIYTPALRPYALSACRSALGLCWKAGVAAEVIGVCNGSIGGMLYDAKVYLEIVDLFSWTLVIVIVSVGFEKVFGFALNALFAALEGSEMPWKSRTGAAAPMAPSGRELPSAHTGLREQAGDAPIAEKSAYLLKSRSSARLKQEGSRPRSPSVSLRSTPCRREPGRSRAAADLSDGIILENVSKSYGPRAVLRDFSCQIDQGSICAVMAPSGTGKTTLMRLVLGLEKPDSGTISGIPRNKSTVFQEDRLAPGLSLYGNLRMAVPAGQEEITSLLTELGLGDSLQTQARALSGGMARRAALARALLAPGNLLILDEPFSGLDDTNRTLAAEAILRHQNGRTVLLVTHREADLELLHADKRIDLT